MKSKFTTVLFLLLATLQWGLGQAATFSFEEVDRLQKTEARPTLVFIGTDWCRYCKKMKHTTFQSPEIINLLEEHYYFVELNAEEEKSIRFSGQDFHFKPTGTNTGTHELATALATIGGQQTYPTVCVLNTQYEITFQYAGFMNQQELLLVLDKLK